MLHMLKLFIVVCCISWTMQNNIAAINGLFLCQRVWFTDYSYLGLFVPWTIRTIDGLFVSWTVCTVDYSHLLGLFVPWTIRTVPGLFVPWTVRTVDYSHRPGLFVPWTVRTVPGRFIPCWERQHSLYSVSQKIPPEVFWYFSKTVGNFQTKYYRPVVRSYLQ